MRRPKTLEELVVERSERSEETECWNWTGALTKGYGKIQFQTRVMPAHRASYEVFVGPIPDGLVLDHLCRNKACVNPAHLEPVTGRENILRGTGIPAKNARKTHCNRGHEFSEDNVYRMKGGGRMCKTCRRDYMRELMRSQRSTPKGREAYNAYMRDYHRRKRAELISPTRPER